MTNNNEETNSGSGWLGKIDVFGLLGNKKANNANSKSVNTTNNKPVNTTNNKPVNNVSKPVAANNSTLAKNKKNSNNGSTKNVEQNEEPTSQIENGAANLGNGANGAVKPAYVGGMAPVNSSYGPRMQQPSYEVMRWATTVGVPTPTGPQMRNVAGHSGGRRGRTHKRRHTKHRKSHKKHTHKHRTMKHKTHRRHSKRHHKRRN